MVKKMRRDLPFLASMVFNRPLLIRRDNGESIINTVGPRILEGVDIERAELIADRPRPEAYAPSGSRRLAGGAYMQQEGIAVLPIVGSLVRRASWLDAECGLMSYGLITDAVSAILSDPAVRGLMLEIDSPGGEAAGCFDCADFIRAASETTGKPVWAHANEVACSGGYVLASPASRIWVARTSEVGSIGVIGAHVDQSEADKKAGVKWTFITAGEHKAEGNSHEPLTDDALARFQADVDHLMEMFVETVAQNRGMTAQEIRDTKADIYRGALAVDAGLADELGTFDEALEAFAAHVDQMQTSGSGARISGSKLKVELMAGNKTTTRGPKAEATEDEDKNKNVVAPTEDENEDDENKPKTKDKDDEEGNKPAAAALGPDAIKAETERCAALASLAPQAARLGVNFDLAAAISGKVSVDAARAKIMDAAASGDAPETSAIAAPKQKAGGKQAHTAEDKRGMWKKAFKGR